MQRLKTSPSLVPPPPVPPVGRIAAASQEPSREPAHSGLQTSFLVDAFLEFKRITWPKKNSVSAASLVTMGLLLFFVAYVCVVDAVAGAVFHALGINAK